MFLYLVWVRGKKMKKLKKDIVGLTGVGVGLGLGTTLVEKAGGDATALTTATGFLPIVTPIIGGGVVMGQLKDMHISTKKAGKSAECGKRMRKKW